jgi:hypothetical protein
MLIVFPVVLSRYNNDSKGSYSVQVHLEFGSG